MYSNGKNITVTVSVFEISFHCFGSGGRLALTCPLRTHEKSVCNQEDKMKRIYTALMRINEHSSVQTLIFSVDN